MITASVASNIAVTAVAAGNSVADTTTQSDAVLPIVKSSTDQLSSTTTVKTSQNKQSSVDDLKKGTEELNSFMQSMSTDIRFVLHTKTNTLMIQIEDSKTHRILKECPSHELLDMMARLKDLKDYIGSIVDKKA